MNDSEQPRRLRVALLGAGNISERYVIGMRRFGQLEIAGCADVVPAAAEGLARRTGIATYPTVEALLADPGVDIVVDITPPTAHEATALEIIGAGKHVYLEKPLTTEPATAAAVLQAAAAAGVLVGAAPDTFLGSAAQTARRALDDGVIGVPIGALAAVRYSRAEEWHPDPSFLFQPGGGPSLDLGPYYLTALVNLLGPVAQVSGFSRIGAPVRRFTAEQRRADSVEVTTPTHASASLRFASGAIATFISSFDIWDTSLPFIEVYGELGTLQVGDPNEYDSPVRIRRHSDADWWEYEPVFPPSGQPGTPEQLLRGAGVADLATAVAGGTLRASGDLARHVLDVIAAIDTSSERSEVITIKSTTTRPAAADPNER
ncbi:MAG: Gfo/Idh/MocA family oxidoreductase [Propionicimonas sp.]|uniref:Gfo/Idh/MocA family protein n=1 Tax=Propionicimonas sp. TaxID=1955623 RepID=UPI002B1F55BD|nr:Gfo/Idh/MocA family oxidoreductase [Propionicimonas sp.]MEA4945455.1 Gfo/Idh/MocA family oxidoreductase [Propionicimonas sp.]MEA5117078.1 Gfo/Idh/MocA family oxidoreductase [Propionicimonas sp.]